MRGPKTKKEWLGRKEAGFQPYPEKRGKKKNWNGDCVSKKEERTIGKKDSESAHSKKKKD